MKHSFVWQSLSVSMSQMLSVVEDKATYCGTPDKNTPDIKHVTEHPRITWDWQGLFKCGIQWNLYITTTKNHKMQSPYAGGLKIYRYTGSTENITLRICKMWKYAGGPFSEYHGQGHVTENICWTPWTKHLICIYAPLAADLGDQSIYFVIYIFHPTFYKPIQIWQYWE